MKFPALKPSLLLALVIGGALAVFAGFVAWKETSSRAQVRTWLRSHALAVSHALWNLDAGAVRDYLDLAAHSQGYARLTVYDLEGDIFTDHPGPRLAGMDRACSALKLIPRLRFSIPIVHAHQPIGRLEAVWYSRTIYDELYALLALGLGVFMTERHLRVVQGKHELEQRVQERTRQLSDSNVALQAEIEDRRRAVAGLRASEERNRAMLEAIPDAIFHLRNDGVFLDYKAAEGFELLISPDQFLGRRVEEVMPAALAEATRHSIQRTLRGERHVVHEYPLDLAGKVRHFEARYAVSGPEEVLGIVRDITSRRQAEAALLESRERLRAIIDSSNGLIWVKDLAGRFLVVNHYLETTLGRSQEQVIGRTAFDLFPHNLAELYTRNDRQVLAAGQLLEFEETVLLPDGVRTFLAVKFPLRDPAGQLCGLSAICTDITDRKLLESRLRQQQRLESLGTLAGGVAHEINNPINGVMNYAQLLQERLPAGHPLQEFAREILREAGRVATIVRNLLTFARHDKQSHSPAHLRDILEGTLSLIRSIIKRDQITLTVDVPDELPMLKCRSQQLQQVLMNLLTNGRDALNAKYPGYHDNKILSIHARPVDKAGQPWLRLTVEDHGTGIASAVRERMFEPFYTTKDRTQGTGLGLSISLGIVQEHHGELLVESEPGHYTRFHVDLPVDNGWELDQNRASQPTT